MERSFARETPDKIGKSVRLFGWVHSRRDHGKLVFIDLRDSSGIIQIVGGENLGELRPSFVIEVTGEVGRRPPKMVNPKIPTGEVEVVAKEAKILAKARELPFPIDVDGYEIEEEVRLKYRYLDLRRERLARNLRLRHQVISFIRNFLDGRDFVEIETPILTKATPEGARDFLVPSRLQTGKFYALPQSPQQYKQLLMVAGFEKYYQIARCFRDEDPRADRAYGEFTQLDLEMSFVSQEEILSLIEELFTKISEIILKKKVLKKPFPKITFDEAMKKFGDTKFDLRSEKDPDILAFAWVLDFPLFEKTAKRQINPSHHPFTAPKTSDIPLLDSNPLKVRSWQHDLILNGYEVGGGSLRITDPKLQQKVFKILGHKQAEIDKKFGHLLTAFEYGVPPHGGIALGIDRFLMAALGEPSVHEVIAFPATASGQTSVMDAPSEVDKKQLEELGIRVIKKK